MKFCAHHLLSLAAAALCALAAPAQAASISLAPPEHTGLPGTTAAFDLIMNFAPTEATLGGSVDIDLVDLTGRISFVSFTPSAWFNTVPDPAFSGHGTLRADADYEVHMAEFNGLSGTHVLGTVTVNLISEGTAELRLATNSFWGGFFGINSQPQAVTMTGATVTIVPEPSTALLWLLGAGTLGALARRRPCGAPR
ncbi:MAG: PEP-CTERM sorting domain-containing protein [Chitinophagaceae bacterium]|nr:PEP-CTERM sorting domain-containing protein [Rubrivivax sp.]